MTKVVTIEGKIDKTKTEVGISDKTTISNNPANLEKKSKLTIQPISGSFIRMILNFIEELFRKRSPHMISKSIFSLTSQKARNKLNNHQNASSPQK